MVVLYYIIDYRLKIFVAWCVFKNALSHTHTFLRTLFRGLKLPIDKTYICIITTSSSHTPLSRHWQQFLLCAIQIRYIQLFYRTTIT